MDGYLKMSRQRLFNVVCIFLWVAIINASYIPYTNNGAIFSPIPYFHYESSKTNPMLSGYTYGTQDVSGASSVMFMTGPNSGKDFNLKTTKSDKEMTMTMLEDNMQSQKMHTSMSSPVNPELQTMKNEENMKPDMTSKTNIETVKYQRPQQLTYIPNSAFQRNPNLQFPIVPQFYVVSNTLNAPYFSNNGFAQVRVPPYALRNPFIQFINPTPYLSFVNVPQGSPSIKDSYDSSKVSGRNINSNCTKAQENDMNSNSIKVTPASEYVTNAADRMPMKEEATGNMETENKTEKVMESSTEMNMDKTNNTNMENSNATMAMRKEPDEHMETMEMA